ncbi:uncharacterized protein CLUP02_00331 [Colletotrichum lupini]|uniref:Uncharacterized protein n=1 Tax=Colletotrichum lupini TaxID=145971 RepID=A0A9Q8W8V8_9PEZI|nr:uncharacterized protein CLUP02_00331 [Colletotrichum lupini]UQC73685.1 hypothetical protein CLUP02_00331 [Colletotrichum lupini]
MYVATSERSFFATDTRTLTAKRKDVYSAASVKIW